LVMAKLATRKGLSMKTKKEQGPYDDKRRAFESVDDMAYFLGRSVSYCQKRLTGGEAFTEREVSELVKAVNFYDLTDIDPVKFQRMQKRQKNELSRFVFSIAWVMIGAGANMVQSIQQARTIASGLYENVPDSSYFINQLYELTE